MRPSSSCRRPRRPRIPHQLCPPILPSFPRRRESRFDSSLAPRRLRKGLLRREPPYAQPRSARGSPGAREKWRKGERRGMRACVGKPCADTSKAMSRFPPSRERRMGTCAGRPAAKGVCTSRFPLPAFAGTGFAGTTDGGVRRAACCERTHARRGSHSPLSRGQASRERRMGACAGRPAAKGRMYVEVPAPRFRGDRLRGNDGWGRERRMEACAGDAGYPLIRSLEGSEASSALSACAAPVTGSPAGSSRPICTSTVAWSQ